ncbi:MAG TPA: phosphatase PAP2 family protein [Thermoanaerobaculia bacterium]|nr:phosphatase PAP2 family protein [Thermoanaerobaculia bacterium]
MRSRLLAVYVAVSLLAAGAATAEVVVDWNNVTLNAIRTDKTPPPKASRALAMVHVAVFDAVDGILGGYSPYHVTDAAPPGASPEAATVAAAHKVLVALYPAQQATFDAARATSLAAIPDGAAKTSGIAWGETVAAEILALRSGDHSGDASAYEAPAGAGWWAPTPPAFAPPLLPNWPTVTPWALHHGSQLRPPAPPAPNTGDYTHSFDEVQLLGKSDSTVRSAEQTQIALFWADGSGTATPPGHWNVIAQGLAAQHQLSLLQRARLFALLNIATADAAVVSWDAKYVYGNWRPVTGIQHAGEDGNPATRPDPTWLPLISTPPFPSYTSGHSTFSGAASRVLANFFGGDAASFSTTSDGLPGVTRSYTSFSQAAEEAGQSRIYGGIHWQYDNQGGLASGRDLGDLVSFSQLAAVVAPGTCVPDATTLCLGGRFEVQARWSTGTSSGAASVVSQSGDSGQLYFFDPGNVELTVKVLDACDVYDRYWVFASGLTNVEVLITVTDTQAGRVRQYFNPRGRAFAPVQDVGAFATCP